MKTFFTKKMRAVFNDSIDHLSIVHDKIFNFKWLCRRLCGR